MFGVSYQERRTARQVLSFINDLTWLDQSFTVFQTALETLASVRPQWLLKIMLPDWYRRYSPNRNAAQLPPAETGQNSRIREVRADIQYLLEAVDRSELDDLKHLAEIEVLRSILNN